MKRDETYQARDRGQASDLSDFNRRTFAERIFEPREPRLAKALRAFEAEAGRGRLLDVAAGSGIAAEALMKQGWTVFGP